MPQLLTEDSKLPRMPPQSVQPLCACGRCQSLKSGWRMQEWQWGPAITCGSTLLLIYSPGNHCLSDVVLPPEMTWPCICHCGLITSVSRSPLQVHHRSYGSANGLLVQLERVRVLCPGHHHMPPGPGLAHSTPSSRPIHLRASSMRRRSGSVSAVGNRTAPSRSLCHAPAPSSQEHGSRRAQHV